MTSLTKQQIEVEERERHRIAKDLHDSLGQQLSAIKLYLNVLKDTQESAKKARQKSLILKSVNALDEAVADLSNICFNLMPITLNSYGLVHAVEDLIRKIRNSKKIEINLVADKSFPALDKTLEINIFRVIQEFLNNSLRHSEATEIDIALQYKREKKELRILLKDNGKGFDVSEKLKTGGMGLKNVKSRILYHNGNIEIKSNPRTGTTYDIQIPLKNSTK